MGMFVNLFELNFYKSNICFLMSFSNQFQHIVNMPSKLDGMKNTREGMEMLHVS
jgi:hypothetical protein